MIIVFLYYHRLNFLFAANGKNYCKISLSDKIRLSKKSITFVITLEIQIWENLDKATNKSDKYLNAKEFRSVSYHTENNLTAAL
jgi:hypothetical protein